MAFLKAQTSPLPVANILHSQLKLSEKKLCHTADSSSKTIRALYASIFPLQNGDLKKKKKLAFTAGLLRG